MGTTPKKGTAPPKRVYGTFPKRPKSTKFSMQPSLPIYSPGLVILHTVPIAVDEDDLTDKDDDSLRAMIGSVPSTALIITKEKKEASENDENANTKYEELFTAKGANEHLNAKLELNDNQKYLCLDQELSSKLVGKLARHILIIFKMDKSNELLEELDKVDNIKIVKSKGITLETDTASKIVMEGKDSETDLDSVVSALTEGECFAVLGMMNTGVEVDQASIPAHVFIKQGVSLDVVEGLFG